jgi:hypothetical protein
MQGVMNDDLKIWEGIVVADLNYYPTMIEKTTKKFCRDS